jgi:hypothetical protein
MPAPSLTSTHAREIADAEAAVASASRALHKAKAEREKVRGRHRRRLRLGQLVEVGGYAIKRIRKSTGSRFDLNGYLEKHELSEAMAPFVSSSSYEHWHVKALDG